MGYPKEILNSIEGGVILDVGTGNGAFINLMIHNLAGYRKVIGIDSDPKMIEEAKASIKNDNIVFEVMSGDNIKYDDESFDAVSISNSLHHLSDMGKTLNEMKRVLKPGGYFIINELFCDNLNEKQMTHVYCHHFQADIETLLGIFHTHSFEKERILEIVDTLELEDISYIIHENEIFNQYVQKDKFTKRYEEILKKLEGYPQHDEYSKRFAILAERINKVGVEFSSQLLIAGRK